MTLKIPGKSRFRGTIEAARSRVHQHSPGPNPSLDFSKEGLAMNATRICSIDGCERKHKARGYCVPHYSRLKRAGDIVADALPPVSERFWAKVVKRDDGCWQWVANTNNHGYGKIRIDGRTTYAHRWAYESEYGEIAPGLVIDHMCHTKECVNPEHLRTVTPAVNAKNRVVQSNSTTGITGVWMQKNGTFAASVKIDGRNVHLGYFETAQEAGDVARAAREKHYDLPTGEKFLALLGENWEGGAAMSDKKSAGVAPEPKAEQFDPQKHYVTRNSVWDEPGVNRVWMTCRCGWDSGLLADGNMPTTHRAELMHYMQAAGIAPQAPSYDGLLIAMLGTSDGNFIDSDSEVPAGEMFRLAAEYLGAGFPAASPVYDVAKLAKVIERNQFCEVIDLDKSESIHISAPEVIARAVIASLTEGSGS